MHQGSSIVRRPYGRLMRALALLRSRAPALLLAIGVVLGEAAAWFLPDSLLMVAIVAGGVGCFLAPVCLRILIVTLLLGMTVGAIAIQGFLPAQNAEDAILLMQIREVPRHPRVGEVIFLGRDLMADRSGLIRCRAVDLPWRSASLLQKGDVAWVRARLNSVGRERNPFSWSSTLWRQGVTSECDVHHTSRPVSRGADLSSSMRERFKEYVIKAGGERRGIALFLSIAFGFRDLLSEHVERAFMTLGMTHLLVVSGFQVGLVFVWISSLLRVISRYAFGRGARLWGALGGVVATAFYVYAIGGEVSVIRAFVAVIMVCLSGLRERSRSFLQRWAVALVIVEILWPFSFFDPGVQLTFAALAGIGVGRYLGRQSALWEWIWIAVCVWLYTSVVLLPRTGVISLASLVINPLIAGAVSILNCIGGILAVGLYAVGLDPSATLLESVAWINEKIAALILSIAAWPGVGVRIDGMAMLVSLELLLIGMSSASVWRGVQRTRWGLLSEKGGS
jgi:ComEC/Rec2-related protein